MRHHALIPLTLLALLAVGSTARAQTLYGGVPPGGGSPISPYLNLQRIGSFGAVNYYGLVVPQLQMQSAISGLQLGQAGLFADQADIDASLLGYTGHATRFGNYSHYYPTLGTTGLGGGMGQFAGQRNLQQQRRRYSPVYGLGGTMGQGLGGMGMGSTMPGVGGGTSGGRGVR